MTAEDPFKKMHADLYKKSAEISAQLIKDLLDLDKINLDDLSRINLSESLFSIFVTASKAGFISGYKAAIKSMSKFLLIGICALSFYWVCIR